MWIFTVENLHSSYWTPWIGTSFYLWPRTLECSFDYISSLASPCPPWQTLGPLADRRPGTCSITTFLCEKREEWVSLSCWAWLLSCWPLSLLPTLNLGFVLRSPMTAHCPLHRCCRWGQQLRGDLVHQPTVCKSLTREYFRLQDDGLYETSLVS